MASKVKSKNTLTVEGILSVEDGKIMIEIEDRVDPFDVGAKASQFEGKTVTLTIANTEEL